ncbi:unnamed protein product [Closterium sp. NIES-54]
MENRGAPTPSGGAAGKGAREKRGAPSQVIVANGLLSKTKADSAAQLSIVDRPVEPVGKRPSSVLGEVCLSEPGSPPPGLRPTSPSVSKKRQAMTNSTKRTVEATKSSDMVELGSLLGQAHVEKASTVVAARHEKSKKSKVIGFAPPPPPDNQCKTRGCKAPFKGSGKMSRKGKPVSEQTVGLKKRFLGTFETEADQKKLSREDIKKDALAAANATLCALDMATRASAAAMAALVSVLLHVGKTFLAKQWPDLLYASAPQGLGSTDANLLQMVRVAAQVCTQWCCCRFVVRLLEDAGYGSMALPEEKSKVKLGDKDDTEAETGGQGE